MFHMGSSISDPCAPTRRTVYLLNFILSAVGALITYFTTPLFLARGVSEANVGFVYALAAIVSIITLFAAPKIFTRLGNYRALGVCGLLASVALVFLAIVPDMGGTIALFVSWSAIMTLVYLLLDMILEGSMPSEGATGGSRGLFISMANAAWFVFPVLAGMLATIGSFPLLYGVAALLCITGLGIALIFLKDIRNHVYTPIRIGRAFGMLIGNKDLGLVFLSQLLLRIFYAVMVIYTPLYLLHDKGVSLESLGSIISIAMIAYLLFEWPVGKLADNFWGEKELMALGFFIMAGTTAFMAFASGPAVLVFGAVLFLTRVGAAFVDVTTESYFFKQVSGADADLVSMFRMLGPVSYIIGPIIGSVVLLYLPIASVFITLGIVCLLGIPISFFIRDTR